MLAIRCVWPGDHEVDRRPRQAFDDAADAAVPRRARRVADRVGADRRALVDDHDLDVDALAAQVVGLALDALGLVEEQQARGVARGDQLRRLLGRGADHADPDAVDLEHVGRLDPGRLLVGGLLDDVRAQEREVRPRLVLEDARDAVVELVVAEARGVEPPRVLDVDRRDVLQQRRDRRRRADVVTRREQQRGLRQRLGLLVEHRRELARAAHRAGEAVVVGRRRLRELTVEVVQAHDRDRRVAVALLEDVAPHDALGVLRLGDPEQERDRRREVDRADVVGLAALDRRAAGEERGAHVRVGLEVLHVRHVAVLAEERRAGDQRAGRLGVELVRRVGERDDVTRAGRVRHVGRRVLAVRDVARLGLGVGAVDDLPALGLAVAGPVVGVLEREERGLDLVDGRRFLGWPGSA